MDVQTQCASLLEGKPKLN